MKAFLKALGVIAQALLMLIFGVVLYALSPLLFFVWLGCLGVLLFLVLVIYAVRAGVTAALDQNGKVETK